MPSEIKQPLADQLRPTKFSEIVGQDQLIGKKGPIYKLVKNNQLQSYILYGEPGTGKSTIAFVIANELNLPAEHFNAAIDNKAHLQKLIKNHPDQTFVLVLDEIHRLTKPIQDFLLPYVEHGQILLIGTTTENPIINVSPAIRSRTLIFKVKPVNQTNLNKIIQKTATIIDNDWQINPEISLQITNSVNGDVRNAINTTAALYAIYGTNLTKQDVIDYQKNQNVAFDKNGTQHYDTISAFQKSIRGWDTDASLYYLAILLASNDLKTITRRLRVIAYEDVGLADPQTVAQVILAIDQVDKLGMPEARIPLANAVILLCTAPHSNSAIKAIDKASIDAKLHNQYPIPNHLRDAHYQNAKKLGVKDYKYAHDFKNEIVNQQYLPDVLLNRTYYQPQQNQVNKHETKLKNRYAWAKSQIHKKTKSRPN